MAAEARRGKLTIPREHGFWAMLLTVLVSALLRTPLSLAVAGATLAALFASVALGAYFSGLVRRSPTAQVASSVLLAFSGAPVELAGGTQLTSIAATTGTWAILFAASSIMVRSAFARAGRSAKRPWRSRGLTSSAVLLCVLSSIGFCAMSLPAHAGVLALGALGCALIAVWEPSVKQPKLVGIALTALIACCGVLLALYYHQRI